MSKLTPNNYAFIDSQNLNLGVESLGWKLDYKKFRLYLKNKYSVNKAFLFIGFDPKNQSLYSHLQAAGFILIFKKTISYRDKNGKITQKGNVDAELVLHAAAIEYENYDKAIIVSGDGDFACLIKFLEEKNKILRIITPNSNYSSLLKTFSSYITEVKSFRKSIEFINNKKARLSGRSKP